MQWVQSLPRLRVLQVLREVQVILAADVYYDDSNNSALAAGVLFSDWKAPEAVAEYTVPVSEVAPYEPGAFYKRELPCLMELLASVREEVSTVVIDGFVDLSGGRPGLGRHLYDVLGQQVPVIGVAKSAFKDALAVELLRGSSLAPLFVSSVGMNPGKAADLVHGMHGPHRIPTLLQRVDALSRGRGA